MDTICMENYREYLICQEKSTYTIEKYLRDAATFMSFLAGREIRKELCLEYKQQLIDLGYSVCSINSMLASVNNLLDFLGLPLCRVKRIRQQRQVFCSEEKELTKSEYLRLLKASRKDLRLNLILQTICSTGIRVSELTYFTVEDLRKGEIRVQCKGKNRLIFLPQKLKIMLLQFAETQGISSGPVFVTRRGKPMDRSNIWAQMKKLCEKAGVAASKVYPHNLRKLFAKMFYGAEKDIAKLADILGHSSIETTRIYIMTSGNEHRRLIDKLGLLI